MKKLILVLLSITMLQGCFYQVASNIDIKKAIKFCGGVDKVQEIEVWVTGEEKVICSDTNKGFLDRVAL